MKKTLIISLEYPPQVGGIATYVHALASALPAEQTIVLAPPAHDNEEWDKAQTYRVIRAPFLYPAFVWPRWWRLWREVKQLVKKENVERILVHHVLPVGYVAQLAARLLKVKFVVFSHGTDIALATRTNWKTKRLRQVLRRADAVVFNSQSLLSRALARVPEFQTKSGVIYPCPDELFYTPPASIDLERVRTKFALEGKRVLLTVARLVDGKGFPHLIPILETVLKDDPNTVWIIVGSGPKTAEVVNLIQKHGLQNSVRFVGEVAHVDLNLYYHLADIFVLLTHPDNGQEEGLGLVFLEAAAVGLPVIAGKSGGVEEGVKHNQTGFIFDVYNQKAEISAAIVNLLHDPALCEQLGRAGQARMRAEFNWTHQLSGLRAWLE